MTNRCIPRILHQIYLSGPLPAVLAANVQSLIDRNPGWEHRLYDARAAEEFIGQYYGPHMLRTYRRIDERYGAARADILRHLIIHRFGGVYCDIKSSFDLPLDQTIRPDDKYLLAQWRNGPGEPNAGFGLHHDLSHITGGEFITYFIIGEPQHAFSNAVIRRIVSNIESYRPWSAVGRTGVLRTTGPIAYTLAIHPLLARYDHRFVTERQLGARPSIEHGYVHEMIFKRHYSRLSVPVVKLGRIGNGLSRLFVLLRAIKRFTTTRRK